MEDGTVLFAIECTTCLAKLSVRTESAIGQILACPKCGSMVQVVPPSDWASAEDSPADEDSPSEPQPAPPSTADSVKKRRSDRRAKKPETAAAGVASTAAAKSPPAVPPKPPSLDNPESIVPPSPPPVVREPPGGSESVGAMSGELAEAESLVPPGAWASPTELLWRKWLVLAIAPVAGIVLGVSAWSWWFRAIPEEVEPEGAAEVESVERPPAEEPPPADPPQPAPLPFDSMARWIPADAVLHFRVPVARLTASPSLHERLLPLLGPQWNPSVGAVLETLALEPDAVARVSWSSTDLSDWTGASIVVIELRPGEDVTALADGATAVSPGIAGLACRRVAEGPWPHPFAVLDGRAIVTGPAQLLEQVSKRAEAETKRTPLQRLLQRMDAGAELALMADLEAARQAGWRIPEPWSAPWLSTAAPWQVVGTTPVAMGVTLLVSESSPSELALVCNDPAGATDTLAAVESLISTGAEVLAERVDGALQRSGDDSVAAALIDRYVLLLVQGQNALETAQAETVDDVVWLRANWTAGVAFLPTSAIGRLLATEDEEGVDLAILEPPQPGEIPGGETPVGENGPGEPEDPAGGDAPPDESLGPPPERKPVLIDVAVDARLADPITAVEFDKVPLAAALDLLAARSTLLITFDTDEMTAMGLSPRYPVTAGVSDTTVAGALAHVLSPLGLTFVARQNQLWITSPDRDRRIVPESDYTVSDLTGDHPVRAAELVQLMRRMIAPDTWRDAGGQGTIRSQGDRLWIQQDSTVRRRILSFCEKLRLARGLPLKSKYGAERFPLSTPTARARAMLARPVMANFHTPEPLTEVLDYLASSAKATIVVDWLALTAEGIPPGVEASVNVHDKPLRQALAELLEPLGLTYRPIDDDTLEVTTPEAAMTRLTLQFHSAGDLIAGPATVESLIGDLKGRLKGAGWDEEGGPGAIHYDSLSGCLIVRHAQPVQARIETLLGQLRTQRHSGAVPAESR